MIDFLSTSEVDETDQKGFTLKSSRNVWDNKFDANDNCGVNRWKVICSTFKCSSFLFINYGCNCTEYKYTCK